MVILVYRHGRKELAFSSQFDFFKLNDPLQASCNEGEPHKFAELQISKCSEKIENHLTRITFSVQHLNGIYYAAKLKKNV